MDFDALKSFKKGRMRPLLYLTGKGIIIDGFSAEGVFDASINVTRTRKNVAVKSIVYGDNASDILLRNLNIVFPDDRKLAKMEIPPKGV